MGERIRTVAAVLAALCLAPAVFGHAIVLSAKPGQHEIVSGPDVEIELKFNSRIDAKRSRLILVMPEGAPRTLMIKEVPSPDRLASEAKSLKSGSYILRWQVLAADGHITRGEVPFNVK